jgi:transposase
MSGAVPGTALLTVQAIWLSTAALDMRAGPDTVLARVVGVFGGARPHHAYCFANRRGTRLKVLVHDGIGLWLAARRLHSGGFVWPQGGAPQWALSAEQFQALVLGLPWQRLGEAGVIRAV